MSAHPPSSGVIRLLQVARVALTIRRTLQHPHALSCLLNMAPGLVVVPVLHCVHRVPLVLAPTGQHGLLLCLVKWSHLLYIIAPLGPRCL